jgi:hypothetical protein
MTGNAGSQPAARLAAQAVLEGTVITARQIEAAQRRRRRAWFVIGLAVLRSRGFHEALIVAVIALAAVAGLARENQARNLVRLTDWDKRRALRQAPRAVAS